MNDKKELIGLKNSKAQLWFLTIIVIGWCREKTNEVNGSDKCEDWEAK